MSKKPTEKELEKQLREEADSRMKMTPEQLAELHHEELAEADLLDRMDIDPDASEQAKEYIKAFAGEGGHDAGFEEALADSSEGAMDEDELLFDNKELEGKKKGGKTRKSKPKSKRRTKRKSVKRSKRMRRRKSKRTRRQHGS